MDRLAQLMSLLGSVCLRNSICSIGGIALVKLKDNSKYLFKFR